MTMHARRSSAITTRSMRDTSHASLKREGDVPGGALSARHHHRSATGVCAEPALTLSVSGQRFGSLHHAEAHVDPVIKSGPLADTEDGSGCHRRSYRRVDCG